MTKLMKQKARPIALVGKEEAITDNQEGLILWCAQKITSLRGDLEEAEQNLEHAKMRKWAHKPFQKLATKLAKQVVYYEKMQSALEQGFVIVPNMPLDIFMVRTDQKKPVARKRGGWFSAYQHRQDGRTLPEGEGRNVDVMPYTDGEKWTEERASDGKEITHEVHWPTAFDENPEFPVAAVHPSILEATTAAAELKLFDQVGLVRTEANCGDPICCGVLRHPTSRDRRVTFFLAWWLDPERDL